jgi:ferredoxin
MLDPVVLARPGIDIHLVVPNDDIVRRDLVGELVERSPARQVEPGVVSMAGQDSIADRSTMERKTHMRAAIVNGMDFIRTLQREDRDAVPSARDDGYLLKLIERSDVDESVHSGPGAPRCRGCHVVLLSGQDTRSMTPPYNLYLS